MSATEQEMVELEMPGGGTLTVPAAIADQVKFIEVDPEYPPTGLTIEQRLIMCAREVGAVGKNREASAGGSDRYKFRGYDAVMDATHPVFARWGVLVKYRDLRIDWADVPRGDAGKTWRHYIVRVRWTFIGWDGDTLTTVNNGEGLDNQDKGLGKARSYALKDLLTRMLTMPTGDPDIDNEAHDVPEANSPGRSRSTSRRRNQQQQSDEDEQRSRPARLDVDAQANGFDSAKHEHDEHRRVFAFIQENVLVDRNLEYLRGLFGGARPLSADQLKRLNVEATKLATKEREGVIGSQEREPSQSGQLEPGTGAVTAEHIKLARELVELDAEDYEQQVGVIAQGFADDPDALADARAFLEGDGSAEDGAEYPPEDSGAPEPEAAPTAPPPAVGAGGDRELSARRTDAPPDLTDDELGKLDKDGLKAACKDRGLKVGGANHELRARLRAWRDE